MVSAREALLRLRDGNRRFVEHVQSGDPFVNHTAAADLAAPHEPFAVILGCSDARVSPELVFEQGLGELFVVRVVGNIVSTPQVGSIEYAASVCGARLIVVLGHTRCGAIMATLAELQQPASSLPPNLRSIIDQVRPALEGLVATDADALMREAVRANVRASVNQLCHGSAVLEQAIQSDGLVIVGAEYSLETGRVEFLDGALDGIE